MTPSDTHRLGELLGMPVIRADGSKAGYVRDLRLERRPDDGHLRAAGIIVDTRHAGSMLGYDRSSRQGPLVLRLVIRRLHRGAGYAPWQQADIDWSGRLVRVRNNLLEPLKTA